MCECSLLRVTEVDTVSSWQRWAQHTPRVDRMKDAFASEGVSLPVQSAELHPASILPHLRRMPSAQLKLL